MLRWTLGGWLVLFFSVGYLIAFRGPLVRMHPSPQETRHIRSDSVLSHAIPAKPSERIVQPQERLDINKASTDDLLTLPGIGPRLSARIVAYRLEHGPFTGMRDVDKVPGIGPTRLETLSGRLVFGNSAP